MVLLFICLLPGLGWVGLDWTGPRGGEGRGGEGDLVVGVVLVLSRVCGHDSEKYLQYERLRLRDPSVGSLCSAKKKGGGGWLSSDSIVKSGLIRLWIRMCSSSIYSRDMASDVLPRCELRRESWEYAFRHAKAITS